MNSFKISFGLAVLCATGLLAQPVRNVDQTVRKAEGATHRASRAFAQEGTSLRKMARPGRQFSLGRLGEAEARPVIRKPGLTPVGVSRMVPSDAMNAAEWSATPEGRQVWRLALSSTGAEGLRVRFSDFHVGEGKVWLFGPDGDASNLSAGPYTGDGPYGDGTFWTDIVLTDSVIVAYEPAGDGGDAIPFKIADVSHRFARAVKAAVKTDTTTPVAAAASCTVDSTCHPEYSEPASAVALMLFESGGSTYQCTGSLINSASQPAVPFFLTANHCISTADEARSLIAFFNYQTPACNGSIPTLRQSPRVSGATFLAGGEMSLGDFSLLQLSGFPNVDVKLLGWTADEIPSNAQVTSISHPVGDYKRIAFGRRTRDVTIRFGDGERMPANRGYQVSWFEGVTQGGSSGSPLLVNIGGKEYAVGTLSGGPDVDEDNDVEVCRTNNLVGSYGRFSAAYPYFSSFLTSTSAGTGATAPSIAATALPAGQTSGVTTLTWQASGYSSVQIRVGSPDGNAVTGFEGPTGSVQTGSWASPGMTFFLQNAASGDSAGAAKTIASVSVPSSASVQKAGGITLSPSPITVAPGQSTGIATVVWTAVGVTQVQIRIDSPNGQPMTGLEAPTGSARTDNWVKNGTLFYLQDASDGNSAGAGKTLATVRAQVVTR